MHEKLESESSCALCNAKTSIYEKQIGANEV